MNDTVGIIIRTKNRPVFLHRALASVQAQTYDRWKVVIVNDGGSRDAVEAQLIAFSPAFRARVQCVHNAESAGRCEAGNIGFDALDTDYIVVLDDDDTWQPTFIETCIRALADMRRRFASVKGVAARVNVVSEKIEFGRISQLQVADYKPDVDHPEILSFDSMLIDNFLALGAVMLDRQAVIDAGGLFARDVPVFEDWDLYLRLMSRFDIAGVQDRVANYHMRFDERDPDLGNCVIAKQTDMIVHRQILLNRWLRHSLRTRGVGQYANARPHFAAVVNHDATALGATVESFSHLKQGLAAMAESILKLQQSLHLH